MFKAKEIMTKNVISVKSNMLVSQAMTLLVNNHISGLPVVDDELNLVGMVSEKDFLILLAHKRFNKKDVVGQFMTKQVVSFKEDDLVWDICEFFMKASMRRVPITKDGKLVGILSRRDIIKTILKVRGKSQMH